MVEGALGATVGAEPPAVVMTFKNKNRTNGRRIYKVAGFKRTMITKKMHLGQFSPVCIFMLLFYHKFYLITGTFPHFVIIS